MTRQHEIKVWDLFVRVFHWTLLVAFVVCYVTEGKPGWLHVNFGYAISGLVVLRILWGFVGPRHARFSDFVRTPGQVLGHLKDVARGSAKRYLGHDPAGGAMIVTLLLVLSATTLSGMLLHGAKDKAGPFAGWTARENSEFPALTPTVFASSDQKEWEHHERENRKDSHGKSWRRFTSSWPMWL
jgi:cytochrome b